MDGVQEPRERDELVELLNEPPDGFASRGEGKRSSLPLDGAPAWYNGEDDEGYSAQAAMTIMGRVRR